MKKIIIDPGHGGRDSGAVGFGVLEKDWNLKISLYQYKRLKELGAHVAMTRSTDQTLEPYKRVSKVKNKYDICLSNHWNAFNGSARGVEVIHSYLAKPNLANKVAAAIVKASGLPLRRVFSRKTANGRSDYYFMHRLTGSTRTLIIEYGFIDHKGDHHFYKQDEKFYQVAEAVVKVICEELGVTYRSPAQGDVLGKTLGKRKEQVNHKGGQSGKSGSGARHKGSNTGNAESGANHKGSKVGSAESRANHKGGQSGKSGSEASHQRGNFDTPKSHQAYDGKRLTSIYAGKLRFYKRPSWADRDVYGYLKKGQGFVKVMDRIKVGSGHQYKVSNSKGEVYYVTASPNYVKVH